MIISLDWLKDYLSWNIPTQKLIEELTLKSVEVEHFYDYAALLDKIVVGKIVDIRAHPNADRLKIVEVEIGKAVKQYEGIGETVEVVCGGANLAFDANVAFALPGARVRWHGQGDFVALESATIRGVKSSGMICAAEEIGFAKERDGEIMILSPETKVGDSLASALDLQAGVMEIDVLPNRPDLLSHQGVAREIGAIIGGKFHEKEIPSRLPEVHGGDILTLKIDAKIRVPRYSAFVVSGIKVADSPRWLKNRLNAVGLRPINNIVDITNYLMYDTGMPLHAFDLEQVKGGKMLIREAREGETIQTLDEKEYALKKGMLVNEDAEGLIDLVGIMGGKASEIRPETQSIVLQAAVFDPVSIRKTSRLLGKRTDAVIRYEKGVDASATLFVLESAWTLISEMCRNAELLKKIDIENTKFVPPVISLPSTLPEKVLGVKFTAGEIAATLKQWGCEVKEGKEVFHVTPPRYRFDLRLPIDLVEEVARMYGYNAFPEDLPQFKLSSGASYGRTKFLEDTTKEWVLLGFHEAVNYSFIPVTWLERFGKDEKEHFSLENPLTVEQRIMRSDLLTSLLSNVAMNAKYEKALRLFEMAKIYKKNEKGALEERNVLCAVAFGEEETFRHMKGRIEAFMGTLHFPCIFNEGETSYAEKGALLEVRYENERVVRFGKLSGAIQRAFDIPSEVFWCEIDVDRLFSFLPVHYSYIPLPRFPSVELDLAIVVEKSIHWEKVREQVEKSGGEHLVKTELFDLYTGSSVSPEKKSFAFHLIFRSPDRTLTMEELNPVFEKIQTSLEEALGATIRKV
jgi:phenylalanyl-tRNA synthetase beta chain